MQRNYCKKLSHMITEDEGSESESASWRQGQLVVHIPVQAQVQGPERLSLSALLQMTLKPQQS